MRGLKTTAIIIIAIGGILSLFPLFFYFVHFKDKGIGSDIIAWGVFGDYIGGTINPIIGIVNLALLIAISIYVAKFDNHRQFNEYRYKFYCEICIKFDQTKETVESLEDLKAFLKTCQYNNQFLFPRKSNKIFNSRMNDLIISIEKFIPIRDQIEIDIEEGKIKTIGIPRSLGRELEKMLAELKKDETPESLAIKEFSSQKLRLIGFIQEVMIEGNISKYEYNV